MERENVVVKSRNQIRIYASYEQIIIEQVDDLGEANLIFVEIEDAAKVAQAISAICMKEACNG